MIRLTYLLLVLPFFTFSQVGIGTINPTKDLDINGELRIRTTPQQTTDSILTVDGVGNIGHRLLSSFPVQTTNYQRARLTSNVPVIFNTTDFYVGYVDLNLVVTVFIPANFNGVLDVKSSVPLGMKTTPQVAEGYMGITLWKNGTQLPNFSRKIDLDKEQTFLTSYRMGYIDISYWEIVNTTVPVTHIFEVKGYVEYYSPTDPTAQFVFNMWDSDSTLNFNWGKGYIEYELKGF